MKNVPVVEKSDVIFVSVKPSVVPIALGDVKPASNGKLFLSIAMGVTIRQLEMVIFITGDSRLGFGILRFSGSFRNSLRRLVSCVLCQIRRQSSGKGAQCLYVAPRPRTKM